MIKRIAWIAAMMAMLSACAQTGGGPDIRGDVDHRPTVEDKAAGRETAERGDEPEEVDAYLTEAKYRDRYDRHHRHHHPEPTPEQVYAGQMALLFSAQIFACAFVVVILDGACNFYVSTGYRY